jgi:heterodisulfide reductase subunit C
MQAVESSIKLDPNFKYEVSAKPGGETVRHCFQCGKCEATCPIERFRNQYRPAQVIRAIMLGFREFALDSPTIWLCATCYSCSERCPQGVHFTDIMRVLRNMAVAEGKINPFYKKVAEAILQYGKIFDSPDFINEMRGDLGLPPVTSLDRQEITKILDEVKALKSKQNLNKQVIR